MHAECDGAGLTVDDDAVRTRRAELLRGLRAALPVMISFVPFALLLGAQATRKGMDGFRRAPTWSPDSSPTPGDASVF